MEKPRRSRILSTIGLMIVVGLVAALMIYSMRPKPITEGVWNMAMTTGETENPKRHYVMYTDLMCPYCDVLTRATMAHADEFNEWLDEHDVLFEVRMSDFLYYNGLEYSEVAAEGAYCAVNEGNFWDYYHGAVQKLWDDYHSKGIGDSKTSPMISDMTEDWWLEIGQRLGFSDNWTECVKAKTYYDDLYDMAMKMSKSGVNGLPYFDWNGTVYNGLPGDFTTWEELKAFLNTGL